MTTVFHASESKVQPPYHTWTVAKYHQMAEGAIQTDVPQATVSYQDKIAIMRGSQLMVILRPQNLLLLPMKSRFLASLGMTEME